MDRSSMPNGPEAAMDPDSVKKSRYAAPPDCPKCDLMKSQVGSGAIASLPCSLLSAYDCHSPTPGGIENMNPEPRAAECILITRYMLLYR